MNEVRLRITAQGTVRGLWTDEIDFREIGPVHVTRASHVEFDNRQQCWTVRAVRQGWLRRVLDGLLGRKGGPMLHRAVTRVEALTWEQKHFGGVMASDTGEPATFSSPGLPAPLQPYDCSLSLRVSSTSSARDKPEALQAKSDGSQDNPAEAHVYEWPKLADSLGPPPRD